jgi:isoamylase
MNTHYDKVEFTLPECPGGDSWKLVIDTDATNDEAAFKGNTGEAYGMTGRSLALFVHL